MGLSVVYSRLRRLPLSLGKKITRRAFNNAGKTPVGRDGLNICTNEWALTRNAYGKLLNGTAASESAKLAFIDVTKWVVR